MTFPEFPTEIQESERQVHTTHRTKPRFQSNPEELARVGQVYRQLEESYKEERIPDVETSIVESLREIEPQALPSKPRKVAEWCLGSGWAVKAGQSKIHVTDAFYKEDGTKKDDEGTPVNAKGSLKKAAHDITYNWVAARLKPGPKVLASFVGHWKGGSFESAHVRFDHFGRSEELWVNYEGLDQREEYNDNSAVLVKSWHIESVKEFEEWLNQWASMLQVKPI